MNQPKFKFGDRLIIKNRPGETIWEVGVIKKVGETFTYAISEHYKDIYEHELELYQEPQEKKLYFWISDASNAVKIFGEKGSPEGAPLGYSFYGELELKEENLK